jgi:ABC-2 type transport system permease protein
MSVPSLVRPYTALFVSRFQQMLQYRGAAIAGFITQCWWGGLKVMIFAAFYSGSVAAASRAPMTLSQAITYTWVAAAVRTGAVSYDRLRPVDFYSLWYFRAAGWIAARVLPRAALMLAFAAIVLPLVGLGDWGWRLPASVSAGVLFAISLVLALALSASMVMLLNIGIAASLNARGVNALAAGPVILLSGNLLPLGLFPDWAQVALLAQPFAGLLDIPLRIYFGMLDGPAALAGLGVQAFWIAALIALGRAWLARVLRSLEMQGG